VDSQSGVGLKSEAPSGNPFDVEATVTADHHKIGNSNPHLTLSKTTMVLKFFILMFFQKKS
jgi:hypothetical protein